MNDSTKKYFINLSGTYFNVDVNGISIGDESKLEQFLENEQCPILCATIRQEEEEEDQIELQFHNQMVPLVKRMIIFFKNRPSRLDESNLYEIVQLTVLYGSSPVASLYHLFHNVFTPLLLQESKKSITANHLNLQRQLITFQSNLRSVATIKADESDATEPVIISTLENEVDYWSLLANSTKNAQQRTTSIAFRDILTPLARDFSMLDAVTLIEVDDALEGAHNVLDDLWRHEPPYPRTRMQHLMDVIASNVIQCIMQHVGQMGDSIWYGDYTGTSEQLVQSINVAKKWTAACTHLTQLFWPNYSLNPWTGDSYTPQHLSDLIVRLEQVLHLRAAHRQLVQLLNKNELIELHTSEMFQPFEDLNIMQCGPYSDRKWQIAVKRFTHILEPAEKRVADKLKLYLANVSANTRQLLYEFERYSDLIDRPICKEILLNERKHLLKSLGEYIRHLSSNEMNSEQQQQLDTPRIVNELMHMKQLEATALIVNETVAKLLNDLPEQQDVQLLCSEFMNELKQQHSELFDSWTRELTVQIKKKELSLRESDPVVQFTAANQLMRVNYSARLVSAVREYRQLTALGYRIPAQIEQTVVQAKTFLKHAKALEQAANFHNTIADRMIECQRPMMLAGAVNLARLVQQEEVVTWTDVQAVEAYVGNVRAAVDKLSADNNLLSSHHMQILKKISSLSNMDLIRHLQKWKDVAKSIRDTLNQIEQQGFINMQSWKVDIDRKLSVEFENQYRKSLDGVHLYLPEICADLIYRDGKLQFNPSMEKLAEKYRVQLSRFIDLPKTFRGVSDMVDGSVFIEITNRSSDLYGIVETRTEELFERLRAVAEHWRSWLSIGVLDCVHTKLETWQHWDLNFSASKTFGQEVAKFPNTEERIGCFVINLSSLRTDLESHNRICWTQLTSTLRHSIIQDVMRVEQFVNSATATLTRQPSTAEQIGAAYTMHSEIVKEMNEYGDILTEVHKKNKTLANWTRELIDSVASVQAAWERLESLVDNHQYLIARQIESFRNGMNTICSNLNGQIERFHSYWNEFRSSVEQKINTDSSLKNLDECLVMLKEKKLKWNELSNEKIKVVEECKQFGIESPDFFQYQQIELNLNEEEQVWIEFEHFTSEFDTEIGNIEWIVFRKKLNKFDEFISRWQQRLQLLLSTTTINQPHQLITRLLQELRKYEGIVPVLKYVRGEDFTERHWSEVYTILRMPGKTMDALVVRDFVDVCDLLLAEVDALRAVCKRAAGEIVVRQALTELDQWDILARFQFVPYSDTQGAAVMLAKDFKDILTKIGDHQSLLQSVKNAADYESYMERATLWETKLFDLDYYLTTLAQIQRKWAYLEPIFGSGTLSQDRVRFERLDRDLRHVLSSIERDSRVTSLARYPNIRSTLDVLDEQLTRCQHSLDHFLTEKRVKFPRFLFVGDDDLLEILGQSSREQIIQAHLKKLFAGVHSVQIAKKRIVAMCSCDGEIVQLAQSVGIECPVEDWLNDLVTQMRITLRQLLVQCLANNDDDDCITQYPAQVLCLTDSIRFTARCEQALKSSTLMSLLKFYQNQLKMFTCLKYNTNDDDVVLKLKRKSLLLDSIHNIDVIEYLIHNNVTSLNDWHWQKQLRFYNSDVSTGAVNVHMANARMDYAFEYLGNETKLVRTPLVDKCFLALTQGIHLGMGGNPYGPAGTGKTESVKALGALLGRQVLVFNCDEGVDAIAMARILAGLVCTGAWGCFDEFNRLDETTLSAVSMHIHPIQVALRAATKTVTLIGQTVIEIDPHCGIFVTLNPAGGGYKGRNQLPANLKQLFRPVVMCHPDQEQIARTLLKCDGYQYADLIGRKLVQVFQMCDLLLINNKQQYYDWGLRALKSVLITCGNFMTSMQEENIEREMQLVVRALRVNTLSKLTFVDSQRFDRIVKDVFRNVPFENVKHEQLVNALEDSCLELGLQVNDRQISKCVELYEQLQQRMGVTIVGPSGSGKSTIRKLLFRALNKLNNSLKQYVLNPKSMSRTQLLGHIDLNTRQWTNGVLTLYAQQVVADSGNDVQSWIVCDGDIDPDWIESLNSVLDDNRLLTLPSGWRIQFGSGVNFIFETHDLCHASPATISRMACILLGEEDVSINDIVNNWLSWQPEDSVRIITHLLNEYFYKAIEWIKSNGELIVPCSYINVIQTGLSQLRNACDSKTHFTVALLAGLTGLLTQSNRDEFIQQVFEWTGEHCTNVAQCFYNADRDIIDTYRNDLNIQFLDDDEKLALPLILTAQIRRTLNILNWWLSLGTEQHFLMVGQHGSAKSLILEYLVKERQQNMDIVTIYCSSNITPQYVIDKLAEHCIVVSSNRGRVYRPKCGRLVLHFKRLHLLKSDQWATNILVAFLQQLINYGGIFDGNNLEWVGVESVIIVGTLSSTTTLSTRFTSIVRIHNIDLPENEHINIIYESYLSAILKFSLPINSEWPLNRNNISKLVKTLLFIYNEMNNNFNTVMQQHYVFSLHDLAEWCCNLVRYKSVLMEEIEEENSLLEIVYYEAYRIFGDKLVGENDEKKFETILNKSLQNQWSKSTLLLNKIRNVYYSFSSSSSSSSSSTSSVIRLNIEEWSVQVEKALSRYERDNGALDLQLIPELLSMTSAVGRVVSKASGCVLLAGRSGVGRHSTLRILSSLYSVKFITPVVHQQFSNDLKLAMQIAGVDGQQVYFMLEDYMLCNTNVLDMVNTLLAAGQVPGLYSNIEFDSLVAGLKDDMDSDNFEGNIAQYFTKRVHNNLHLIFCLDIDGNVYRNIFDTCPILCYRCTIIWQPEWSPTTLQSIPHLLLQKALTNETISDNLLNNLYNIHKQVKYMLAVPRRYIAFVKTYIDLYVNKRSVINERKIKLQAGITRLTEARSIVADLKLEAIKQGEILAEKQAKANAALDMISATMQNANVHKVEMETLKMQTEKENQQLMKRKEEIEKELMEVEPMLQEARAAVGNIKTESLSEIRSLRAPPDVIRDILEGVLRLMGTQDTTWNSMKTFLAKRGVKEDIRSFDASKISGESRQAVERLIKLHSESFDPKAARRASVAAAPLAAWVLANVQYSKVVEKTKPLQQEQHRLEKNLQTAKNQIGELSSDLSDVDAQVAALKQQLSTYTKEAAEIEIKLTSAEEKLHRAEGLVSKLNEEYDRWQVQLNQLSNDLNSLQMKCLLSAAYINYLSNEETEDVRRSYLDSWSKSIEFQDNYRLEEFLCSEREQLLWQTEGLLPDRLSIQNAIIILKTHLNVLLLDPTSFATNWLQIHLKHRTIETVTQNAPRFTTTLELAVRFGKVLVIEEVDNISPILIPVLRKEFVYQGERRLIFIGNKLVDCHDDFVLYLSSRNVSLEIAADVRSLLNVVNFTMTITSLTEQLLNGAVHQEFPTLESKLNELLQKREQLEEQHFTLQNRLLEQLASASGDILQNHQLLQSLNETKGSSSAIGTALNESATIQQQLQNECNVLRPLSSFASRLYFATTDLQHLNQMYSISVAAFVQLFLQTLSTDTSAIIANSNDYAQVERLLLHSVYHYVSRGMFKADRLTFALHLCRFMFPDRIPNEEWDLFLGYGKTASTVEEMPDWISQYSQQDVSNLHISLPKLYESLKLEVNKKNWQTFMRTHDCEIHFPSHCNNELSDFQKVLVIRALRPDRLYTIVQLCVLHLTGMKNLSPRVLYLSQLLKETVWNVPVLLITGPGADPSTELRDLATATIGIDKYTEIAMGIGQESVALNALDDCARLGHWLCLKNLHLVAEWSNALSQRVQLLASSTAFHGSFRLWLVTESLPMEKRLCPVLVRSCLKFTYEAPPGIKNNILRSYTNWGPDYIQKLNVKNARLLFTLAYVHALLQERRIYIPQGWKKWYEFNDIDLYTAANLCQDIVTTTTSSTLFWPYVQGLCADAVYSGRIDERHDEAIMQSYMRRHLCNDGGVAISLPNNNSVQFQAYMECINHLPDDAESVTSTFGLPANIDQAWQRNASAQLITDLKLLVQHPADFSNRSVVALLTFWKRLHKDNDLLLQMNVLAEEEDDFTTPPLSTFIREEKRFSIFLLQFVHRSLSVVSKIVRGSIRATNKNQNVIHSLSVYQTPHEWLLLWRGPKEPFKYVQCIVDKALAISKWSPSNVDETFFKSPVNISCMFRPRVFFIALKQHTARCLDIAVDDLRLTNIWLNEDGVMLLYQVSLVGLLIEGALFDGRQLQSCTAQLESAISSVPTCSLAWIPIIQDDSNKNGNESASEIKVPLYASYDREDYLETLFLPAEKFNRDQCLLASVCLFAEQ